MTPVSVKPHPFFSCIMAAVATMMTISVQADQTLGNDPAQPKDPGFFHRASNDVGNFFKRIFKTDEPQQPPQPAPSSSKRRSRGPRYNLDQPPAELRRGTAPSDDAIPPPPASTAPKDSSGRSTKSKPSSRASSHDPDLVEEPPKPKSKTQKSPASNSSPPVASNDAPPRPKTKKPAESPSKSAEPGSVLYSNTPPAETKQPETPAKVKTEDVPPPKPAAETSSVLTGSKTGKSGRVKSPYAPYSELDVTGLPSGSLALDPTTQKVFRIP